MNKKLRNLSIIYWSAVIIIFLGAILAKQESTTGTSQANSSLFFILLVLGVLYIPIRAWLARQIFSDAQKYIEKNYSGFSSTTSITNGQFCGTNVQISFPRFASGSVKIIADIPIRSPHIFLDAHSQETGIQKTSEKAFSSEYRVSLEGDFDKYMRLFTKHSDVPYSLSILSPNVMQTLIDNSIDFDVEIYENKLRIFIAGTSALNYKTLDDSMKCLEAILSHINKISDTYKPQTVQFARMPHLGSLMDSPQPANPTRRFRLPGRHILGYFIFMTLWGSMLFYASALPTRRSYYTSGYKPPTYSMTSRVVIYSIIGTIIFLTFYMVLYVTNITKYKEDKVFFKLFGMVVTKSWFIFAIIAILASVLFSSQGYSQMKQKELRDNSNSLYSQTTN